jgi:prepilin-type N-terminal cleavage/methylation domain-containing protein
MQTRMPNRSKSAVAQPFQAAGAAGFPARRVWGRLDGVSGRLESRPHQQAGKPALRGFSLIELLTAVSIMVVIIFALYGMFNTTQKALRANITQVDVLESGRAAAELIGRDLEQLTACNLQQTLNLSVEMERTPAGLIVPPLVQTDTDGKTVLRTNLLNEIFFLSQQTNRWFGTGYRVLGATKGVGTLYRFTVSTNYRALNYTNLINAFVNTPVINPINGQVSTNFNRVADGVIHLRLTAYDPDGRHMEAFSTNMYPTYRILRLNANGAKLGLLSTANGAGDATVILHQQYGQETQLSFTSNALPAYLDLELGVIEPATLKQFQSLLPSPNAAAAFLKKQAAKVHLFRQRIPIRTVQQ